ncbi:PEP-utilizing enzyme [Streptomyces phyllanthi]|uniref:PEP-utilising enzyme mobile domain-containing protein n=1 Tax=Streptomyces phyllanthi TaxID=1803180 RepID=A0A5N8W094_9ACTN|nr:PEP-utilizing enzyme [Streptomyces phyllanthi]MPY39708.1 hypothetical protein [Streptomyces phyllanthi]
MPPRPEDEAWKLIVLDPRYVRLEPGEILVAPSTDPGWTPLFLTAGGVVLESGGVNSHGVVVAREYGIPAVVGVPGVTRTLNDGQAVTVNGTAGIVSPAHPDGEDAARVDHEGSAGGGTGRV